MALASLHTFLRHRPLEADGDGLRAELRLAGKDRLGRSTRKTTREKEGFFAALKRGHQSGRPAAHHGDAEQAGGYRRQHGQEAASRLVQFAQGIASGRLQGDELRSVPENLLGVSDGLEVLEGAVE